MACAALTFVGCQGSGSGSEEVVASAQQLRSGLGEQGQAFLGLDVLATGAGNAALSCAEGELTVEAAVSRDGENGPYEAIPASALHVSCGGSSGDFALVVDNSGSEKNSLPIVKHAARDIVQRVLSDGGRASLVRVSTEASVLTGLTDDRPTLNHAINGMTVSNGWTALYDGVRMGNETLGRQAQLDASAPFASAEEFCRASEKLGIVAITDGRENNSSNQKHGSERYPGDGLDTTLDDLKNLRVGDITTPIYTIGVGKDVDHAALASVAELTGGRHLRVDGSSDVAHAFDVIGDYAESRHQVCTELPKDVCGPVHVQLSYRFTPDQGNNGNGKGNGKAKAKNVVEGERTYFMDVPCPGATPSSTSGRAATILMALSAIDLPTPSLQRLAAQTVAWVSPVAAPKVLVVLDDNHHGEHAGETSMLVELLRAAGHDVAFMDEPGEGLQATDLEGMQVVWFSNPGYPPDDAASIEALLNFARAGGGVVFQGDDMGTSYGEAFSMTEATDLTFVDNGISYCGVSIDNGSNSYDVNLASEEHPLLAGIGERTFAYDEDIDTTVAAGPDTTVLAWARAAGKSDCALKPVITVQTLSASE